MSPDDDITMLEKFRQLVNISQRIKESEVAAVLGLSDIDLIHKLMEWGKDIPFKIDGDSIVVDNLVVVATVAVTTSRRDPRPRGRGVLRPGADYR